jgi:hypothetical protein
MDNWNKRFTVTHSIKMKTAGILFLSCILCSVIVFGCIYNVRDIGFVDLTPHPYRLFCFIQDDTREKAVSILNQISYTTFLESNVEMEIVNVDQEKNHPAMEYFRFWEIETLPAAILRSPTGKSIVLPISVPDKSFKKTVHSSFHNVISSGIREEILDHVVKSYCVVLLIEGKDEAENTRAYDVASSTTRKIAKIMGQLPKRIQEPPHIIVMPQEWIPEESVLTWSLGLDGNLANTTHIAVIYGRGRRLGPLLTGERITGDRLYRILSLIGLSCDCGLDKRWMMGPLIPLRWDEKIQSDVVQYLGFDAESPMVKTEMSSIISFDLFRQTEDDELKQDLGDIFDEYSEEILEFEAEPNPERVSPAKLHELTSSGTSHIKTGQRLKTSFYVLGSIILLILAGGSIILIRARRKVS